VQDENGATGLHWAAFYNHVGVAHLLLTSVSRPDQLANRSAGSQLATPVHWACR
jgi:ankyrin repeat protein